MYRNWGIKKEVALDFPLLDSDNKFLPAKGWRIAATNYSSSMIYICKIPKHFENVAVHVFFPSFFSFCLFVKWIECCDCMRDTVSFASFTVGFVSFM